jgi:hypothetical protein
VLSVKPLTQMGLAAKLPDETVVVVPDFVQVALK